ncbi:PucR family transcriptional regulator [Sphaerisporangium melleum]|uniref:PucR family transcriptional regulator n=1 Tax=Sphaerisporangium melleum TaxID=321316 RepID=A0A917R2B7_9ACTN|nr:PucR family transcriptional regulator [Sphaerisporangium melleum]GGK83977.1 PucR family transcriptional regulator [Sphaerisporangium melleum]GII69336.1 PucR family transcriptional regulator [Sphaerisporangium melleum]
MAPSLRRVAALAPLRLRVRAGQDALERPVRWVAVSELEDPTPFLEGDELVLTTGMRLRPAGAPAYVARLVRRGVAGLGFGVGLGHEEVPAELVEAAARAGLPLVEVPRGTPFIAIGKAVSEMIAAERYEELGDAFAAQGRLTRAALGGGGMAAVVRRLATEIHGWAALFDETGAVLHTAGAGADDGAEQVRDELGRLRGTDGAPASLALSGPHEHVIVLPLGDQRRISGFFAVGGPRPFSPVGHTVVNTAGSLLALSLEQRRGRLAAERRVNAAVLRLLLAGERDSATDVLAALPAGQEARDLLGDGPLVVVACLPDDAEELQDALPGFTAPLDDLVVALAPADRAAPLAEIAARGGRAGLSAPVDPSDLVTGLSQARRALAFADPVMRFPDLAGQRLLALVDPGLLSGFAAALLAPLREYGSRADLADSLRVYLECNGHWDAAAQRLGVHRHTLRYRMRRVSELLGRDLDDPGVRAELWVALAAPEPGRREPVAREVSTGRAGRPSAPGSG